MGAATLRRYHNPVERVTITDEAGQQATAIVPAVETDAADEFDRAVVETQEALDKARTASEEANEAASADPDDEAKARKAESAALKAQAATLDHEEAQRALAAHKFAEASEEAGQQQQADDAQQAAEQIASGTLKHGDLEAPAATGSTDSWIEFAQADPKGAPFDLTKRTGLRDDIARHYLGE